MNSGFLPQITFESAPTPEQVRFLEERLHESNVAATGIDDGQLLSFFLPGDAGEIRAGLCGHTWGAVCEVRQLWVHESLRNQGLGRALMEAAEAEARRRGCRQMLVETHSFQGPDFYRKLGFEQIARIEDNPRGHQHLVFRKQLDPSTKPTKSTEEPT
jgi:GNAT superfamily N-acetyltransferase